MTETNHHACSFGEPKNASEGGGERPLRPDPVLDIREQAEIIELTERYEKITSPSAIRKAAKSMADASPEVIKKLAEKAGGIAAETFNGLTEQELIAAAIKKAAEGFNELAKQTAKVTISEKQVIERLNKSKQECEVSKLSDICLLRAYDIAAVASKDNAQHLAAALAEGGGFGAIGLAGIPASLALSMLLYFRAVQSIAMFYGYDTKNDPAELVIASEVFSTCMNPSGAKTADADFVGKILLYAELAAVKDAAKKGWGAMVEAGGAALLIAQMRAFANKTAQNAVEKGGAKALEAGLFEKTLVQIGKKLPLKNVGKLVPIVGIIFGALFDVAQMSKTLEIADIFYHQRFILEKQERINRLLGAEGNTDFEL